MRDTVKNTGQRKRILISEKPAPFELEPTPGRTFVALMPASSFVAKMFSIPNR